MFQRNIIPHFYLNSLKAVVKVIVLKTTRKFAMYVCETPHQIDPFIKTADNFLIVLYDFECLFK